MSRIARPRAENATVISSATLNSTFTDFVQPNKVDETNHRDGAVDLAQLGADLINLNIAQTTVGTGSNAHNPFNFVAAAAIGPAPKAELLDASSTPTPLLLTGGWTLKADEVLRVYWDLSVQPYWEPVGEVFEYPWDAVGALGGFEAIEQISLTPEPWNAGLHFWLVSLQWTLTDPPTWVDVPRQSAMQTLVDFRYSGKLQEMQACVPVNAWKIMCLDIDRALTLKADKQYLVDGWHGINGTYYYLPTQDITVHGLRIVIHGVYHPYNDAGENLAVLDLPIGNFGYQPVLRYTTGNLLAIHQFMG